MSEFEHVYLFFEIVSVGTSTIANFFTVVFGMLVASYLAAHRLDRVMIVIALAIYSMVCLGFINEIYQVYSDFARLGLKLEAMGGLPNSDLGWFGPVAVGGDALNVIPKMVLTMTLATYVGSIVFFFRARRANKRPDIQPKEISTEE